MYIQTRARLLIVPLLVYDPAFVRKEHARARIDCECGGPLPAPPLQNALQGRGHIYLGEHAGWYSVSDEAFLTAKDVVDAPDAQGVMHKVGVGVGGALLVPMPGGGSSHTAARRAA
jgi:hypothetical protein